MMSEEKDKETKVIVNLEDSVSAHSFKVDHRVHPNEFAKVKALVDKQRENAEKENSSDGFLPNRHHNTISVFGGRGTGKTSFIYSLLDEYRKCEDIEIIGIIDPTLIEEKGHVFLLIVALINERVEAYLKRSEVKNASRVYEDKKFWNATLMKLSKGIPSLDNVGGNYNTTNWQDDSFIMESGLRNVASAYHLEENFHNYIKEALRILGKRCFLLAFDDIDVDMRKGWSVLETIRKYMTDPHIITVLSGNLKLYTENVRINQSNLIKPLKDFDYDKSLIVKQVNELEGQYMLKLLKPENRIHLKSIYDSIVVYGYKYMLEQSGVDAVEFQDKYVERLNGLGINGTQEVELYKNFLLRLSVRSQINLLRTIVSDKVNGIESIEPFITRMYAEQIPVEIAVENPRLFVGIVCDYLQRRNIIKDSYLLLPVNSDETINCCMVGLSILFSEEVENNIFLLFDYMLKVGYLRNMVMSITDKADIDGLVKYGSYTNDISLKNTIGLSMAYMESIYAGMAEHINLYGLERIAKKGAKNRIDKVLSEEARNVAQRIVGFIPLCSLNMSSNNESRQYYSVFLLLAAIGQLIKNGSDKAEIERSLRDLHLYRSYPLPNKNSYAMRTFSEIDLVQEFEVAEDESFTLLIKLIKEWISQCKITKCPAYLLGRIITRFYSAVKEIKKERLGEQMHRSLVALLNASLVEEANENSDKLQKKGGLKIINFNNAINEDKVFVNNLRNIVNKNLLNAIPFTVWLIKCPLIRCFLDSNLFDPANITDATLSKPYGDRDATINVATLLNQVEIKDGGESVLDEPFSGDKKKLDEIIETIAIRYPSFDIDEKIIKTDPITAKSNIEGLKIFKNVTKQSVNAFRKNYVEMKKGKEEEGEQ